MPDFRVLTLKQADLWHRAWQQLPSGRRDVFACPAYYEAFDGRDGAKAECAVLSTETGGIIYPYLRQPIHTLDWLSLDRPCFDLIGAYGYGGPLGEVASAETWRQFMDSFSNYCKATGVVAEFIRMHPLLLPASVVAGQYELVLANKNVVVNLQQDDETILRSYKHNNRKNIAKALRSGVRIFHERVPPDHFGEFLSIYHSTLDRREATSAYRFPLDLYDVLHRKMPQSLVYFFAEYGNQVVSCELCLMSPTTIYSFLGGTIEDYFPLRPNNLLKHELIRWARAQGLNYYLIGGGNQMNDSLFEYKRSFSPKGIVDFFVAKRVHDQSLYAELLSRCDLHPPHSTDSARRWFLRWRFEAASRGQ